MTFSPTITSIKEKKSFKQRYNKSLKKINLNFGNGAIISLKQGSFEVKFFKPLKKILKKFAKQNYGYNFIGKKRYWLPIYFNYPLTKKSKNSRMGKGKGFFVRWVIKIKLGLKIIETKNISRYRLKLLCMLLQKQTNLKFTILFKKQIPSNKFSKSKNFFWYF